MSEGGKQPTEMKIKGGEGGLRKKKKMEKSKGEKRNG